MGTSNWPQSPLLNKILKEFSSFDFFQAIRLLELISAQSELKECRSLFSLEPPIKLGVYPRNNYPLASIEDLTQSAYQSGQPFFYLQVSFMSLAGRQGALPGHYNENILLNARQGNFTLEDFLDLFNHRFLLLFYQAWKKNKFFVNYETTLHVEQEKRDPFTKILESIAGVETVPLNRKSLLNREIFSFYSGFWGRTVRSAVAVEQLLSEYFEIPIRLLSFQGQWLFLPEKEHSRIGSLQSGRHQFNQLAFNMVLGRQHWSVQNQFRVYLGPINYTMFKQLFPENALLQAIIEMVKIYSNKEFSFDIEVELLASEVPRCQLTHEKQSRLGWNTWISSQPFKQNVHAVLLNKIE